MMDPMIGTPLPEGVQRVLVTGGRGFSGGAMVRRLLPESTAGVFNLDTMGYAGDLTGIEWLAGEKAERHHLLRVDRAGGAASAEAEQAVDPDLLLNLAAESDGDRSIDGPGAVIEGNVTGTFHRLQAVQSDWEALPDDRQSGVLLHPISIDKVCGSQGEMGRFPETTPYDPPTPYSAGKEAAQREIGCSYFAVGHGERTNKQLMEPICALLDERRPGCDHDRAGDGGERMGGATGATRASMSS